MPAAAIVDDSKLTPARKLAAALEGAGFWEALTRTSAGRSAPAVRIVIAPELAGFASDSPAATDPALVEELIDELYDRGFSNASVVGTSDSSALWAENRDLYALSDLLGYRFTTRAGRPYDIIDLTDPTDQVEFPHGSALYGGTISRIWRDADLRIVFTKNRTDEVSGYALCLDTLIGVLPLTDKELHYRTRRHPGDVVTDLLAAAPVQFCLIDAVVSAHGSGGRRAPEAVTTGTIIAASNIILADYVGALKMGLDPSLSPIFARVMRTCSLPSRYNIAGTLDCYSGWANVPIPSLRASQARDAAGRLSRLVEPWLQCLDPELFPLKHPLDARMNATLAGFFADTDASPTSQWLLILANLLLGLVGQTVASYRTLFDKDALHQNAVPLGINIATVADAAFDDLVEELRRLEPIAAEAPMVSTDLRWRYVEEAVVFSYMRIVPIDYDVFVQRVDVARTIQFMNDYLGGVVMPLSRDEAGRPIRQAERNIYLPQPNYLVLYQGKPIDVSKLEVVEYGADRNRLYWKTINSENGSAVSDDGIATFERASGGTRITIVGRQQFVLPLFWQVFDLNLVPELKAVLVTHAYHTFFDRTVANFEALVEGRDIRIGQPVDEAAPPVVEQLMPWLQKCGEIIIPWLQKAVGETKQTVPGDGRWVDSDGFVHMIPATPSCPAPSTPDPDPQRWIVEITRFLEGLGQAAQRDLPWRPETR